MWEDSEETLHNFYAFSPFLTAHITAFSLFRQLACLFYRLIPRASALMISFPSGKAHMMSYWQSISTFLSAAYTIKYSSESDTIETGERRVFVPPSFRRQRVI